MFTKDIGIDLGTANTLVYMKGRGIIMREPSVVAVDPRSDELRVRSVGHEAKAVIGRAPGSIVAVRPLKDGVIADFDVTAAMLQSFIRQACGNSILARPRVVICVPIAFFQEKYSGKDSSNKSDQTKDGVEIAASQTKDHAEWAAKEHQAADHNEHSDHKTGNRCGAASWLKFFGCKSKNAGAKL